MIITPTAPTDAAFENITGLGEIAGDIPLLTDILKYHIVPAKVFSFQLFNNTFIEMLNGDQTQVTTGVPDTETGIQINDSNVISPFDVAACNGVIHTIDKVLLPPTTSSPSSSPTQQPTNMPSASPSEAPSQAPVKGTDSPTQSPSRAPSTSPTTRKPSRSPSVSPSSQPSVGPTTSPSKEVSFYCLFLPDRVYLLT